MGKNELYEVTKQKTVFANLPKLADVSNGQPVKKSHEFEKLAASLSNHAEARSMTTFAIVGAATGVGATSIAQNLAATMAAGGERVLVITVLNSNEGAAHINSADKFISFAQNTREHYDYMEISAASLPQISPKNHVPLTSLMEGITHAYSYVIWDVPPVDAIAHSRLICQHAEGVILVVQAGRTRWHSAQHALSILNNAGARVLGVVLNKKKNYIPEWIYRVFFRRKV